MSLAGSPTIEGFSLVVGLLLVFLIGSIVRTTLLDCIDIFVFSFGFVDLSNVHGLGSTVRVLSSQLLSYICRHTISKFFKLERSSRNLSSTHLGSMALIAAVFTLSATTSENYDSCSTSVSSHCMTATWSSFMFLVRFSDMSLAIDAPCSTTDLGLNQGVTANQACRPSPRLTLRNLLTSVATSLD